MKALHLLKLVTTLLVLQAAGAMAQDTFRLTFTGTCRTTDGSGRIVTRSLLNRDLIRTCAQANGVANLNSLALVYTVGAEPGVDTIDVINATNGAVVCPLYRLAFPTTITAPGGFRTEQLVFMFNNQQSDAIGTALTTTQTFLNRSGATNRISVTGRFQFANPATDVAALALCSGSFTTGARFQLPPVRTNTPPTTP